MPGEVYNICSGRATEIGHLAERLLAVAGVSASIEETAPVPAPGDIVAQSGDGAKLDAATGWAPEIPLDRSLRDLLVSLALAPDRAQG